MLRNELLIFFPQREFCSSDEVKGYAELKLPFPLAVSMVTLEFFGREFVEVNGKKEVSVFHNFSQQLEGPGSKITSTAGNVVNKVFSGISSMLGTSKTPAENVPAGSHRYPFSFRVPDQCPPSFTTPTGAHIDYELRITVAVQGGNMSNLISSAKVPIAGSLFDMNLLGNSSTPFVDVTNKSFMMARSTLDVKAEFESKVFLTGDNCKINLEIANNTTKLVSGLTATLVQKIDVVPLKRADNYILATHKIGDLGQKQKKSQVVQLVVPTTACESVFYKEVGKGVHVGKIVQVSYFVRLHGAISMATDLEKDIPIFVVARLRHDNLINQHRQQFPHLYQQQIQQLPQQHQQQQYQQPQLPQPPQPQHQQHQYQHSPQVPPVDNLYGQQQSQYYPQSQYQQPTTPQHSQPQQPQHSHSHSLPPPQYTSSPMYPSATLYPSLDDSNIGQTQTRPTGTVPPPVPLEAYEQAARRHYEQSNSHQPSASMHQAPAYDEFFD
ncbi:hypothetical protein AKO1_011972 [Acrasis kona]|uniref:Arrestin C-terminal-like domain-containing protein n=1 Tax=Acrasis kona TaxID=1008807 RepID=A0AAW2ZAX1_9EUKA